MAHSGMTVYEVVQRLDGGQKELARLLKISQPAISKKVKKGQGFTIEECSKIHKAAGVTLHELRPDHYAKVGRRAEPEI